MTERPTLTTRRQWVDRPGGHDAASSPNLIRHSQSEIDAMSRSFDAMIIGAGRPGHSSPSALAKPG